MWLTYWLHNVKKVFVLLQHYHREQMIGFRVILDFVQLDLHILGHPMVNVELGWPKVCSQYEQNQGLL